MKTRKTTHQDTNARSVEYVPNRPTNRYLYVPPTIADRILEPQTDTTISEDIGTDCSVATIHLGDGVSYTVVSRKRDDDRYLVYAAAAAREQKRLWLQNSTGSVTIQ